jgi:hypothetical protein
LFQLNERIRISASEEEAGSPVDAEREAFIRFGTPDSVAAHFAAERYRTLNRLLFILTTSSGRIVGLSEK